MKKIPGTGFNGIAAIIWGGAVLMMSGRLEDGRHSGVMSHRLKNVVKKATFAAGANSARPFSTGPTMRENYNHKEQLLKQRDPSLDA